MGHYSAPHSGSSTRRSPFLLQKNVMTSLLLATLCGQGVAQTENGVVDFKFSADPTEMVLLLANYVGMRGGYRTYQLYGDGRLVYRDEVLHGQVYAEYEFSLGFDEMKEILQEIVDYGLMDSSSEDILGKVRGQSSDGRVPDFSETASTILEVRLTSYVRNDQELGPVNHQITINTETSILYRYYPEIDELEGLFKLKSRMWKFRLMARKRLKEQESKDFGDRSINGACQIWI